MTEAADILNIDDNLEMDLESDNSGPMRRKSFFKKFVNKVGNVFQKKKKEGSPSSLNGAISPKPTAEMTQPAKMKQEEETDDVFQIVDEEEDQDHTNHQVEEYLSDDETVTENPTEKSTKDGPITNADIGQYEADNSQLESEESKNETKSDGKSSISSDSLDDEDELLEDEQNIHKGDKHCQIHRILPKETSVELNKKKVYKCKMMFKKKNFFSKLVTTPEIGYLLVENLNCYMLRPEQKKAGFAKVAKIIDLKRLFKCDVKIPNENTVEIFLHLFNKNYNPMEHPVTKKFVFNAEKDKDHLRFVRKLEHVVQNNNLPTRFCEI